MNILTFDIEDWFHILDHDSTRTEKAWRAYETRLPYNIERILSLLERRKVKATFFCLGWVARKHPNIVRRIHQLGYEVGSHSDMHGIAYQQERREFCQDLEKSVKVIEDVTGERVRSFRAPGFSFIRDNKWAFDVMIENGIEIDCSIFPGKRAVGGFESFGATEPCLVEINGARIKEFPISVFPFFGRHVGFSGGGYFRILPYFVIKRIVRRSNYIMTYFHPRDFDPKQPWIKGLPLARKFKTYYGLRGALSKLEWLLKGFEFIDLRQADRLVDWKNAKVVKLDPSPSIH